jgi:hypothetical protein
MLKRTFLTSGFAPLLKVSFQDNTIKKEGHFGLLLDNPAKCLHNDSMTSILIRDVPPKVHNALQEAAEAKGHSLQQYLVMEIAKIAEKSQIEERLKKLNRAALPKIKASTIVDAINSERSRDR